MLEKQIKIILEQEKNHPVVKNLYNDVSKAINFYIGHIMNVTYGKANPNITRKLVQKAVIEQLVKELAKDVENYKENIDV